VVSVKRYGYAVFNFIRASRKSLRASFEGLNPVAVLAALLRAPAGDDSVPPFNFDMLQPGTSITARTSSDVKSLSAKFTFMFSPFQALFHSGLVPASLRRGGSIFVLVFDLLKSERDFFHWLIAAIDRLH